MNSIHILSGKVRTGKSARLLNWTQKTKSCAGILTLSINDKKYILDIASGEKRVLQSDLEIENNAVIKVGSYYFLRETFEWAKQMLLKAHNEHPQWFIIDEIGYLELNGSGFEPIITRLLPEIENNLLLVVREKLLERVTDHFKLKKYGKIFISERLPNE